MGNVFNAVIGMPLGWVMWACMQVVGNYGIAIILFTLFSKLVLFPLSVWVQKNSIKMVKMQPEINMFEAKYIYDKDKFYEEQIKVHKREKYNLFAGFVPLLIQIPLIIGIINVIYNPMQHLLHIDSDIINAFNQKTMQILDTDDLGSSPQIKTIELINNSDYTYSYYTLAEELPNVDIEETINLIKNFDMKFLGFNLADMPDIFAISMVWLIPLLAGLSSFVMCVIQNKINVLQIEQSFWGKWGMTIFLTAFSLYFGFAVAAGVGMYWIFSNAFAIGQMYLLNFLYNPKKFIDYAALEESKTVLAKAKQGIPKKKLLLFDKSPEHKREVADYKRFFKVPEKDMKLVFYSEASGFYKYFQNIIEAVLKNSDLKIHYVTSDPNDAVFKMNEPNLIPYYIGENKLISLMMKITADMVVMTMPDLQMFHIKRSLVRKDVEYVFTDHGGTSLNLTYRTGALDYFDTVFAASEEQAREIRAIEQLRGTKKKNILKLGNPVLDSMIVAYESSDKKENQVKTILIAPSWQEDNILDSCLDFILDGITEKGWRIIVRPHPQYIRRFPDSMKAIIERYYSKLDDNFIIQTDFSSNTTVYTADLVITDWSAIGTEYSFTTLKPTLFVDTKMKVVNPDYNKIDIIPYDITGRNIIGKTIEKNQVNNIYEIISELFYNQESYKILIKNERERYFYNLGHSGETGADYIIKRL